MCPLTTVLLTVQKGSLHVIYLWTKQFSLAHSKFFLSKEIFITLKLDTIFSPNHLGDFFPPYWSLPFKFIFMAFHQVVIKSETVHCGLFERISHSCMWRSLSPSCINARRPDFFPVLEWSSAHVTCLFTSKGALSLKSIGAAVNWGCGSQTPRKGSLDDTFIYVCDTYVHVLYSREEAIILRQIDHSLRNIWDKEHSLT